MLLLVGPFKITVKCREISLLTLCFHECHEWWVRLPALFDYSCLDCREWVMMVQQHKNFIGRKLNNLNGDGYHNDHMILGLSSGTQLFTASQHTSHYMYSKDILDLLIFFVNNYLPLSQALWCGQAGGQADLRPHRLRVLHLAHRHQEAPHQEGGRQPRPRSRPRPHQGEGGDRHRHGHHPDPAGRHGAPRPHQDQRGAGTRRGQGERGPGHQQLHHRHQD